MVDILFTSTRRHCVEPEATKQPPTSRHCEEPTATKQPRNASAKPSPRLLRPLRGLAMTTRESCEGPRPKLHRYCEGPEATKQPLSSRHCEEPTATKQPRETPANANRRPGLPPPLRGLAPTIEVGAH